MSHHGDADGMGRRDGYNDLLVELDSLNAQLAQAQKTITELKSKNEDLQCQLKHAIDMWYEDLEEYSDGNMDK